MKFILGKKIGMTRRFNDQRQVLAATLIAAGPCLVTKIKTPANDGYTAVQLGFGVKKESKVAKSLRGQWSKIEGLNQRWPQYLREFRVKTAAEYKIGQEIKVDSFQPGDRAQITGVSKGKGFQGVVRRHGFHGSPATHGHKDQLRMPGSIGPTDPGHVFKGKRMAGHMGDQQVTLKNLTIIEVIPDKNLLLVTGAVPGARNGLLKIKVLDRAVKPNKK